MTTPQRSSKHRADHLRNPRGSIPALDEVALARLLAPFDVSLDSTQMAALGRYWRELAIWTRRLNLVSSGDLPRLATRHIVDAFAVVEPLRQRVGAEPSLETGGACILDLGSGGGLPGIPVAIALRTWPIVLVEQDRRRSNFLRACVRILDTVPLSVVVEDAEKLELPPHGMPAAIVTRAAFPLATLLRVCERLLPPGGWLLAHRSPGSDSETAERAATDSLQFESSLPYELPGEARKREIQIWRRSFT